MNSDEVRVNIDSWDEKWGERRDRHFLCSVDQLQTGSLEVWRQKLASDRGWFINVVII